MGVGQIFRDFSGWTSAHGIPLIGGAPNFILRIFWALVLLGSTTMFTYQLMLLVQKYLDYDVIVSTEVKFEEKNFPAVTICNLNPYKKTQINLAPKVQWLMSNYTFSVSDTPDPNENWGLSNYNDTIGIQNRARDHLVYLASDLRQNNPSIVNHTTYTKEDLIMNCVYNTKACDLENDFQKIIDPIYGACYTFNNRDNPYLSSRAGPYFGLKLLLKANQSEYLPIAESAGVRISVHGQNEEPFPDAFGYSAAVGFTTSFGLKFIRTLRLPHPYGDCTEDKGTDSFYYDGSYSIEGCIRSCFQDHIYRECGCFDPRFGSPTEDYCTNENLDCISKFRSSQIGVSNFNANEICDCPTPCNESSYGVTVSTALWPSDVYRPRECKNLPSSSWSTEAECKAWYSENTMYIQVYYERMNYQLLTESKAYGIVQLISDTGGQLGLWMGFSVITMVEFCSLVVLLVLYCLARRKGPNLDDADDDDEDDENIDKDENIAGSPPPPYDDDITPYDVEQDISAPPTPN